MAVDDPKRGVVERQRQPHSPFVRGLGNDQIHTIPHLVKQNDMLVNWLISNERGQ